MARSPKMEAVLSLRDRLSGAMAKATAAVKTFERATTPATAKVVAKGRAVDRLAVTVTKLMTRMAPAVTVIKGFGAALGRAATMAQSAFLSVGKLVTKVLALGALAGTLGTALVPGAFAFGSIRSAAEFESAMRFRNVIAQEAEAEFAKSSQRILELSERVPQTPAQLAGSLREINSATFEGEAGFIILEAAAKAASAGMTEVDVVARPLASTLKAYSMDATEAGYVTDVLFRTMDRGIISFEELATVFGDVLGTAAAAKVPIHELGAALAVMTQGGLGGAEAVTSLNQLLLSLIGPTPAQQQAFKKLGLNINATSLVSEGLGKTMDRIVQRVGLSAEAMDMLTNSAISDEAAVAMLNQQYGKAVYWLNQIFPNIRALRGVLQLARNGGADFANELEELANSAGATDRAFAEVTKTFHYQWQQLISGWEVLKIKAGTTLLPALNSGVGGITNFLNRVTKLEDFNAAGFIDKIRIVAREATAEFGRWFTGPSFDEVYQSMLDQGLSPAAAFAAADRMVSAITPGRAQLANAGAEVGRMLGASIMGVLGLTAEDADASPWVQAGRTFGRSFAEGFREHVNLQNLMEGTSTTTKVVGGALVGNWIAKAFGLGGLGALLLKGLGAGGGWLMRLLRGRGTKAAAEAASVGSATSAAVTGAEVAAQAAKGATGATRILGPSGEVLSVVDATGAATRTAAGVDAAAQGVRGARGAVVAAEAAERAALAASEAAAGAARGATAGGVGSALLKGAGKVAVPVGLAASGLDILTSDDKAEAVGRNVGGWAGAWAGAKAGALGGGAVGSVVPGLGTAAGGLIGGILGGIGGWFGGEAIGSATVRSARGEETWLDHFKGGPVNSLMRWGIGIGERIAMARVSEGFSEGGGDGMGGGGGRAGYGPPTLAPPVPQFGEGLDEFGGGLSEATDALREFTEAAKVSFGGGRGPTHITVKLADQVTITKDTDEDALLGRLARVVRDAANATGRGGVRLGMVME